MAATNVDQLSPAPTEGTSVPSLSVPSFRQFGHEYEDIIRVNKWYLKLTLQDFEAAVSNQPSRDVFRWLSVMAPFAFAWIAGDYRKIGPLSEGGWQAIFLVGTCVSATLAAVGAKTWWQGRRSPKPTVDQIIEQIQNSLIEIRSEMSAVAGSTPIGQPTDIGTPPS